MRWAAEELIGALRKEGDEKVREIRKLAEAEAEKMREQVFLRLEALGKECAQGEECAKVLLEADRKTKVIRLSSEEALSARLFRLAVFSLPLLRESGYEDNFRRLFLELPPLVWHTVKVHPDDLDLARRFFPGSEIIAERSISGGMETESEEGGVRVVNTFEKRLERAWTGMLPGLLDDVKKEAMGDTSSRGN